MFKTFAFCAVVPLALAVSACGPQASVPVCSFVVRTSPDSRESFFGAIDAFAEDEGYWLSERAYDHRELGVSYNLFLEGWRSSLSVSSDLIDQTAESSVVFSETDFQLNYHPLQIVTGARQKDEQAKSMIRRLLARLESLSGIEVPSDACDDFLSK